MHTTIRLQHNFSFGYTPVIFFGLLLLLPLIIGIIKKYNAKKVHGSVNNAQVTNQGVQVPRDTRSKYVDAALRLRRDYRNNALSIRDGYQSLSIIVREYVSEHTGNDITKKTLAEIRNMDLGIIENLIEEFYYHEFSTESDGDLEKAIDRTIEAIRTWN